MIGDQPLKKTSGRWPNPLNVDFQIPLKHLHISQIKKLFKSPSSLNHTANLPKFLKKIKFQSTSCKCFMDQRNRQRVFEICKNCPGIWMRCIKWAKSGEAERGSALKICRGGFKLTLILQEVLDKRIRLYLPWNFQLLGFSSKNILFDCFFKERECVLF